MTEQAVIGGSAGICFGSAGESLGANGEAGGADFLGPDVVVGLLNRQCDRAGEGGVTGLAGGVGGPGVVPA